LNEFDWLLTSASRDDGLRRYGPSVDRGYVRPWASAQIDYAQRREDPYYPEQYRAPPPPPLPRDRRAEHLPPFRDDRRRFDGPYPDEHQQYAPDDPRRYDRHPRDDETRSQPIFECVRGGGRADKVADDLPKISEQAALEDAIFIANEQRKINPPNGLFYPPYYIAKGSWDESMAFVRSEFLCGASTPRSSLIGGGSSLIQL
jgi:hypothetical protein